MNKKNPCKIFSKEIYNQFLHGLDFFFIECAKKNKTKKQKKNSDYSKIFLRIFIFRWLSEGKTLLNF